MLEKRLLGNYRLLRRIGTGGMGEVYMAEDTRIARQVAIKVIRAEIDPYPDPAAIQDSQKLFLREMRAITRLDHPHILQLFDFGEERLDNSILTYMVMPLRQEGSLADWLQKRGKRLNFAEIAHFLMQAAEALQHAHDYAIVHQDIKPANFLVRDRVGSALPDILLSDFGIAKAMSATSTASQTVRGTPAYMAPEQWEGSPVPASDQYALGIMAYVLLTGQPPFSGRMEQVMRQHLMIQPPPPSTTNPAIPPDLDKVILIALAKQPEARFGSVMAFTRAFQQAIQPASESSSPPGFIMPTVEAVPQRASEPLSDPVRLVPTAPPPPIEAQTPSPLAPTQYANGPAPMPAHTKKSRIMGLALIALVLVLISSLLFGVSAYQQYAHNLANATATAQANTAATQATVDAIAQAGTPYGGTLIISDPMDGSSSAFQWDNRNDSNGDQCQFNGGAYHVSGECSSSYFPPAKFAFEIQLVAFHSCGEINYLSKGFLDDAGNFGISICQDGSYQLSGNGNIQQGSASSMDTGPDQSNIVDVVIDGSNITLYINQTNVASIPDNAAYLGSLSLWGVDSNYVVGLGTGTSNDFQEVVYTNARLWSL